MPSTKGRPSKQAATSDTGDGATAQPISGSRSRRAQVTTDSSGTKPKHTTTARTSSSSLSRPTVASAAKASDPRGENAPATRAPLPPTRDGRQTKKVTGPPTQHRPSAAIPQSQKDGSTTTHIPSAAVMSAIDQSTRLSLAPAAGSESDETGQKATVVNRAANARTKSRAATPFPRDEDEDEDEGEEEEEEEEGEEEEEREAECHNAHNMLRQEDPDRGMDLIRPYRYYVGDPDNTFDWSSGDEMLRQENPDMFSPYGPGRAYDEYGIELGPSDFYRPVMPHY